MRNSKTKAIVILGLLTAMTILFSFTPIGTIKLPELSITLNVIPIAIGAIALGPVGGLVMGSMFGIFSFLQCIGIGIPSGMGAAFFEISPVLAFLQRFVPRALDGLLIGLMHRGLEKKIGGSTASFVTGFFAAFLNTLFFMSSLVLMFGQTEYVQNLYAKFDQPYTVAGSVVFCVLFVGINAVVEMAVSTIIGGSVGTALYKSRMLPLQKG